LRPHLINQNYEAGSDIPRHPRFKDRKALKGGKGSKYVQNRIYPWGESQIFWNCSFVCLSSLGHCLWTISSIVPV